MLEKVTIKNFKKLENISFSLSQSIVLIGPNNAGKSTIFQALCLWEIGVVNYIQAYQKKDLNKRNAAVINRRDLLNSPISDARFLWHNRRVTKKDANGGQKHIILSVEIEGKDDGLDWKCKAEFEFSNNESFSCRITSGLQEIIGLYNKNNGVHFGFLQPMSGISINEDKLTQGSIDRKLGEGRTAEVLRNICYEILYPDTPHPKGYNSEKKWDSLTKSIKNLFGAELQKPEFIKVTGIIELKYIENSIIYDISSGGRGFQQTLLLLAYMYANPNTVLLLDEPDAHLEVIRQREVFQKINDVAADMNSQLLIASHSEIVLDEAAEASNIIAIIENTIYELNKDRSKQNLKHIKKSLTEIGWEKYYLARSKKHVLYLEGSTDLHMLQIFAKKLQHEVEPLLRKANVQYTADNVPNTAVGNYVSLKEIFHDLKGLALFDRLPNYLQNPKLTIICWEKRELENYFAKPQVLIKYAKSLSYKFPNMSQPQLARIMENSIKNNTAPVYLTDLNNVWWSNAKVTDEWFDVIFTQFYKEIGVAQDFYKRDYYKLIELMAKEDIDQEITDKLDAIYEVIKD
ncbi:ATP-dependent nuclease [Mucilaginibacter sp.]